MLSSLHEKESRMDTGREQIDLFLHRCDEVMQSKFILAESKISELLKAIATSDLLYAFFRDITKDFDYAAAQAKYMNYAPYGSSKQKKLLFPDDSLEKLAFIFCLLVDIDKKTLDLNWFLQEYFYEDGSFYEAFYSFCNQVIKPFRNDVKGLFHGGVAPVSKEAAGEISEKYRHLAQIAKKERETVYAARISDEIKVEAMLLLNALVKSAEEKDRIAVAGLLSGYKYFILAKGWKSSTCAELIKELEKVKESL